MARVECTLQGGVHRGHGDPWAFDPARCPLRRQTLNIRETPRNSMVKGEVWH